MSSWKIATISGIEIRMHWTLLLVFGFLFLMSITTSGDFNFTPLLMFAILFIVVTYHELAHSLVGREMGISIEKIVLWPIGGMAVLKQISFEPKAELKMALAGPMSNFALCAIILLLRLATGWDWLLYDMASLYSMPPMLEPLSVIRFVVSALFWFSLFLGLFNLFVPAFPMDGGRVFRAFLAMRMDYLKATRIATTISNIIMVLIFLLAFYVGNWALLIVAVFILIASRAELEATVSNKLLGDFPLSKLIRQNYLVVDDDDTLDHVIADMIASRSIVAFYKEDHKILSVSIYDIQGVPKSQWKKTKFLKIAKEQHPVTEDHTASFALNKMRELGLEALPVMSKDQITGCVFMEDIDIVLEILKISKL